MSHSTTGLNSLNVELSWLESGMESKISEVINDMTVEAHGEMANNYMAIDTGHMSNTSDYILGYLKGSLFTKTTKYAGFTNGNVPITNRPYTTTPFLTPTVEFINSNIGDNILKVVGERGA